MVQALSSSITWSCLALCDPMDYSTPGFPVHHQLLEPTQTHVHCVSDAIQPSHALSHVNPKTALIVAAKVKRQLNLAPVPYK